MKNWYQYANTDFIPIFLTCERNTHVVKFHVAIMHIPHIDKYPTKLLHFAFDSNSSHAYHNFINVEGNSNVLLLELLGQKLECLRRAQLRENLSTVFPTRPASLCNYKSKSSQELIFLLMFICNYVVSVLRGFLFLGAWDRLHCFIVTPPGPFI